MAGLRALYNVLCTGQWKTSYQIFEMLTAFRDPNQVSVSEFYEPKGKINYLATFIGDRSVAVRVCFYKTLGRILLELPDRVDHEGRVFPFMMSGLYDKNDDIRKLVFELIEEIGQQHEESNEEKFREIKQLGYNPEWM